MAPLGECEILAPEKSTSPDNGRISPAMVRIRVVLPMPERPIIPTISPGMISRLQPSRSGLESSNPISADWIERIGSEFIADPVSLRTCPQSMLQYLVYC